MKKIICLSIVSVLAFFVGRQGADVPNERAAFISKLEFASSLNMAFAAGPEEDAGKMAEGLWAFAIESQPGGDTSVYEFITEILDDISSEMQAQGYAGCNDVPTSGSDLLPSSGVTVNYSVGTKLVPSGSNWLNSGNTYSKRMTASVGGVEFAELQYDCNSDLNIYFKYDFNQFQAHDRVAEFYVQKGAGGLLNLELKSTCTDASQCGVKQNTLMSFHTPDGNEIKVVGTRTEDNSADVVKSISLHGDKNLKLADIHIMDHTDLTNIEDIDPLNASVIGACVDFNQATYIPTGGAADCVSAGVSANNALVGAESDAFGVGDIRPATIHGLNLTY